MLCSSARYYLWGSKNTIVLLIIQSSLTHSTDIFLFILQHSGQHGDVMEIPNSASRKHISFIHLKKKLNMVKKNIDIDYMVCFFTM